MSAEGAAMWWAPCDDCGVTVSVDGDGQPVPDPNEWDSFPSCPVCGSSLSFDESAETHWQRENRLMRLARKAQEGVVDR